MSLTVGTGPFAKDTPGAFNFHREGPERALFLDPSPRRIRGLVGDYVVVDSRRVHMLHETGHLPVWYFPEEDVRVPLEPGDKVTRCPIKGEARHFNLRAGGRTLENAVWAYPEPIESAPFLRGLVAFYFDAVDRWLEEDEEVIVHPRDPYHRIDVRESSRHVRVLLDGEVLADSRRTLVLFETGLPPRHYLPVDHVRMDLLRPSDTQTGCAYKGFARYRSAAVGDRVVEDAAWYYPEPLQEAQRVGGRLCFFDERVDVEVDGKVDRPHTQWS